MKSYNNFNKIASDLHKFFESIFSFKYHHLDYLVFTVISFINSGSVVASKISNTFNMFLPYFIQPDSTERKIRRFFSSFSSIAYDFYSVLISYVIKFYKVKHHYNIVHISLDHMYVKERFTILLFSLRIGKQGIPLWFRCFKGHQPSKAMSLSLVNEGISFCSSLFTVDNVKVIFLADRWFSFISVLKHIESLHCFYVFRVKSHFICSYTNSSGSTTLCHISDIKPRKHSSKYISILFTAFEFPTNLVVVRSCNTDDTWYLLTNDSPNRAAHNYSKRFGSIECIFKHQKTNRFLS